jgi:hypothetical protein
MERLDADDVALQHSVRNVVRADDDVVHACACVRCGTSRLVCQRDALRVDDARDHEARHRAVCAVSRLPGASGMSSMIADHACVHVCAVTRPCTLCQGGAG